MTGECRASGLFGKTKDHLFTLRLPVLVKTVGRLKKRLQKLVGGGAAGEGRY